MNAKELDKARFREAVYRTAPSTEWLATFEAYRALVREDWRPTDAWQPISTAPKDGTKFDAWLLDSFGGYLIRNLSFDSWGKLYQNGFLTDAELPRYLTHWRPLPAPPVVEDIRPEPESDNLVGLAVWCVSIADHHADVLTPRQIEKLYAAGDALRELANRNMEVRKVAEMSEDELRKCGGFMTEREWDALQLGFTLNGGKITKEKGE